MGRTSVPALLAFASTALAVNQPPQLPPDSQIGLFEFPITCSIMGLNQTFNSNFSATAPVYGGSGQEIYYTDTVGNVDIPAAVTSLGALVGATQASANVSFNLRLVNASPANLLAYQGTLNNISFASGKDANIRIPQGNGTLPALGPVTLGKANLAHRIFLGEVDVSLELQDSKGKGVMGPLAVKCGRQNVDFVLGSVNVDNSTGAPLMPANGYQPSFPATPSLYETGSFRFPYQCNFGALGPQTLDVTIGGTLPGYFKPNTAFNITNAESFLRIPASLVSLAKSAYPKLQYFDTTVSNFDILYSNAKPTSFNVASTPIKSSIDVTHANTSEPLVIAVPTNGYLPAIGPVTSGADGSIVGISIGNANATATLVDNTGKTLLTIPVSCAPAAPLELIGIPVSSLAPGNYTLGFPAA